MCIGKSFHIESPPLLPPPLKGEGYLFSPLRERVRVGRRKISPLPLRERVRMRGKKGISDASQHSF